mgnify:CR=1 FL=1
MDGDAPLSPGNPHLLAAVRTFEIAMVPILHSIAPGDPKIPNRANRLRGSCIPAGRCRNSLRCG